MRTRKRTGWRRIVNGVNIAGLISVLFIALPLYWMTIGSFETPANLASSPPQWFPVPGTTANYSTAFSQYHFWIFFRNSLIVTIIATALVLALGTLAGYALGRTPMRGKFSLLVVLLMISVFPEIAIIAPLYLLMREIGWLNSYQALILPYTAFNLPFAIWILRNYFLGISMSMEESARVDGAGALRTLWSVVVPQVTPGIFTAGVFTFTACWTEFLMALSFNQQNNMRTIPVGIATFGSQYTVPYGTLFAASVVAVVPIAILVLVFRKAVVSGLTSGAVKG